MKTIGLIGGMSWESTVTYYQIVNRLVQERLGGFHSAKCILHSVDFHEIEACQRAGDWERSGELLAEAARGLERAGADCVLICTNTMHKVASLSSSIFSQNLRAVLQSRSPDAIILRQHHTIAPSRFDGSFPPILRFEKFEIHTVFLRFSNLGLTKNLSPNLLAELCGAALGCIKKTHCGDCPQCVFVM